MYGINKWLEKVKKAYGKLFKKALTPKKQTTKRKTCLLYTSPSPRDGLLSRMPSSA